MSLPRVLIIVLNWNGKQDTLACLESLQQVSYPNLEVLLVDNGSSDNSVQAILDHFPQQLVIETGETVTVDAELPPEGVGTGDQDSTRFNIALTVYYVDGNTAFRIAATNLTRGIIVEELEVIWWAFET